MSLMHVKDFFLYLGLSFVFLYAYTTLKWGGGVVLLESQCLCVWALSRRCLLNHSTFCSQTLYDMVVHHEAGSCAKAFGCCL